jgi:preprotein translocase subunit YajC
MELLLPLYIVFILGLVYLAVIRPQQRRRRELQNLISRLSPGDEVITVAGIYGTITELEDGGTVLLEVAENTDIRVAVGSIARVVTDRDAAAPAAGASASE